MDAVSSAVETVLNEASAGRTQFIVFLYMTDVTLVVRRKNESWTAYYKDHSKMNSVAFAERRHIASSST
jgi:hypothetical protein